MCKASGPTGGNATCNYHGRPSKTKIEVDSYFNVPLWLNPLLEDFEQHLAIAEDVPRYLMIDVA
jgi:hypothetical protein